MRSGLVRHWTAEGFIIPIYNLSLISLSHVYFLRFWKPDMYHHITLWLLTISPRSEITETPVFVSGYFKYEGDDDRELKQCSQQFFLAGWWFQVIVAFDIATNFIHESGLLVSFTCCYMTEKTTCFLCPMQHTIFCWWHLEVDATDRYIWCWSSTSDSWKFRVCVLVTACQIVPNSLLHCFLHLDHSTPPQPVYTISSSFLALMLVLYSFSRSSTKIANL